MCSVAKQSKPPDGHAVELTSLRSLLARSHSAAAAAGKIAMDSEVWRDAVGDRIARHARPGRLNRGVLTVHASSSVWAQELSLLSHELTARLKAKGIEVQTLRFAVTVSAGTADGPPPAAPPRRQSPVTRLPEPLRAQLANVDDPELRRVIAEAASESLALRSRPARAVTSRSAGHAGAPASADSCQTGSRSRAEQPAAQAPRVAAPESAPSDRTRPGVRAALRCTRAGRPR